MTHMKEVKTSKMIHSKTLTKTKELINLIFMLTKTVQIHDVNNAAFLNPLEDFVEELNDFIQKTGPFSIEGIEENIYLNEEKIKTDISTFASFKFLLSEFEKKNISGVNFLEASNFEELKAFYSVFAAAHDQKTVDFEKLNALLTQKKVKSIEFIEKRAKKLVDLDSQTITNRKKTALSNYVQAIDHVKDSMRRFEKNELIDSRKAKRLVYNLVDLGLEEGFSFIGLSTIKNYDEYTFNHSVNVCIICIAFAQNLGLSKRQIGEVGMAGLYHDFGKLSIPREILNKAGGLTKDEWETLKKHPAKAVRNLINIKGFSEQDIKKIIPAFEHHMGYDNKGYPDTASGRRIHLFSRIVAIADSYDAMTTDRVYQKAKLPSEALKIIADGAGTRFDPILVKAFINTVGIYPVGSLVKLSNKHYGLVSEINKDPEHLARPKVIIVMDPSQRKIKGPTLDMSKEDMNDVAIVSALNPDDYDINPAHYLFG